MNALYQLMLFAVGIGTLAGCGSASAGPKAERLAPVKGRVTMDNKPIEGATVIFLPQGSEMADGAIGITDPNGNYEATAGGANGAPVGHYKVIISRLIDQSGQPVIATLDAPPANRGARESISPKYSDHALTPLKCSVSTGGGTFDFKLASR